MGEGRIINVTCSVHNNDNGWSARGTILNITRLVAHFYDSTKSAKQNGKLDGGFGKSSFALKWFDST